MVQASSQQQADSQQDKASGLATRQLTRKKVRQSGAMMAGSGESHRVVRFKPIYLVARFVNVRRDFVESRITITRAPLCRSQIA
jgi:hypothetical protein